MTAEERIAQLEMELAQERAKSARVEAALVAERAENDSLRQQMEQVLARLREVEWQLAKDSHNSSKPPSSDSPGRKRQGQRHKSEKQMGGQPGHADGTLMQVANPDEVIAHRLLCWGHCQQPLEGVAGRPKERRQVHDLPEVRLRVSEHQVEEVQCPSCQRVSRGAFRQEWRHRCSMDRTCKPSPSICISTSWSRWHGHANSSWTCVTVRS